MESYSGSCHCGAVTFEMLSDNILDGVYRCDCSLCEKKGIVMKAEHKSHFMLISGSDQLSSYQWNRKIAEHFFCKECGVYTHHKRRRDPNQICINVACLNNVEMPEENGIGLVRGSEHD